MSDLDTTAGSTIYARAPNGTPGRAAGQIVWSLLDEDGTIVTAENAAGVTEPQAGTYQAAVTIPLTATPGVYYVRLRDTVNGLTAEVSVDVLPNIAGDLVQAAMTLGEPDGTNVLFAVEGREYTIRRAADGVLIDLWADKAGATPLPNPLAVDRGRLEFWAAQGIALERVDNTSGDIHEFTLLGPGFSESARAAAAATFASLIPRTQKAAPLGVATLDAAGKLPVAQLPASPLQWRGTWDASTNTPALVNGTGSAGDTYRVVVAANRNLGAGVIAWAVGDLVVYSPGGVWQQSPAGDVHDLRVAALELNQAAKSTLARNVKDPAYGPSVVSLVGAIADGATHPLSDFFPTLAAAQVVYPHATALTNELDWAACQKAQNAAVAAGGDDVYHPRGTYMLGDRPYAGGLGVVNRGAGQGATFMKTAVDRGLATFAVTSAAGQADATHWEHMTFRGPRAAFAPTVGVRSCLMNGILAASWCHMHECEVLGYGENIVITGNHQKLTNVRSSLGFFNVHFGDNTADGTRGDQQFSGCTFDKAAFANVAIHGTNEIVDGTWSSVHAGFAPYAFYKYDKLDGAGLPVSAGGGAGASTHGGIVNCHMTKVSFEEVGNECICDESTGAVAGANSLLTTTFDECVHTDGPTYRIAGRARDYAVRARVSRGCVVRTGGLGFAKLDIATYHIPTGGIRVEGGWQAGMFSPGTAIGEGLDVIAGSQIMRAFGAASTITAGDILEAALSGYNTERYGTSDKRPLIGVAAHAAATGDRVLVCLPPGDALVGGDATSFGGMYLVPGGGGGLAYKAKEALGFGMSATFPHEPFPLPAFAVCKTSSPAGLIPVTLLGEIHERGFVQPQAVTALPAASAAYRGVFLNLQGGGAVPDKPYVCGYDGAGGWAWTALY